MIKRWQDFFKEHLIQTVSTEQSYCAFDCRRLTCEGCPVKHELEVQSSSLRDL